MEFYGLIGRGCSGGYLPRLHNGFFLLTQRSAAYKDFELEGEEISLVINSIRTLSIKGVNVAMPYKKSIIAFCDILDKSVTETGSVDVLLNDNGCITGYNTAYRGFGKLYEGVCPQGLNSAAVISDPGNTDSVILYLHDSGIDEIILISDTIGDCPFENMRMVPYDLISDISADVIINGKSFSDDFEIPDEIFFHNFKYAIDLCGPTQTEFIRMAERAGLVAVSGRSMLIHQAVLAQEIWQGHSLSPEFTDMIEYLVDEV